MIVRFIWYLGYNDVGAGLTVTDLMIIALLLSIVMTAVTLDMLNWGLGKHMWDVPAMPNLSPWFMKVRLQPYTDMKPE